MANPNPQGGNARFKGVRDMGYASYEKNIDPTDVIKFGKRVNYENKLTTDQVMEDHLKMMRQNLEYAKITKEMKRKQEREFLSHIANIEDMERQRIDNGRKAINSDFVSANGIM
jgi:hypothetical protein